MAADKAVTAILHACGLPARWNEEFVTESIRAIAAWRRWTQANAARWLLARVTAAEEQGAVIDKWWFVNGEYRHDPRPTDPYAERPPCRPDCPLCGGTGWVIKIITTGANGRQDKRAMRCRNRGGMPVRPAESVEPQLKELANAKAM